MASVGAGFTRRGGPYKAVAVGAAVIVAALGVVLFGFNVAGLRDRLLGRAGAPRIESLAVLPLENLIGDPAQEYFVDGMTEALIADLGQIEALRVISRTSVMQYKGVKKPLPQIARELNVDAVVEGSVLRSGDRVRMFSKAVPGRLASFCYSRQIGTQEDSHVQASSRCGSVHHAFECSLLVRFSRSISSPALSPQRDGAGCDHLRLHAEFFN